MNKMKISRRAAIVTASLGASAFRHLLLAADPPAPYGAVPSPRQLAWHELETYSFLHFTVNTFTNKEWGEGDEDPNIFQPTDFDPDRMMLALKAAGMKGVILTCKHHDGFCLWPTKTTDHSVKNSSWRNGKGDVVRDVSRAARKHGLQFGIYVSPWDRNNAAYGQPAYIDIYRRQLTELLTHYGPVFEVWHDGANGGTGYYGGAREKRTIDKTKYYDWPNTWALIRKLQPNAVIFSDAGPDLRWVGNEKGFAAETSWATFTPVGTHGGPAAPGDMDYAQSPTGTRNGKRWMPAECDVSIRPGWFWHAEENDKVKSPRELMDLYYKSVGRGASFLLNVPPDRRGQFSEPDVKSLEEFGKFKQATFSRNLAAGAKLTASNIRAQDNQFAPANLLDGDRFTFWSTDDNVTTPELTLEFGKPVQFNVIRLREEIRLGQRIAAFTIDCWKNNDWTKLCDSTSIGNCRLIRLDSECSTEKLRLRITDSAAAPALSDFGLFAEPE
jgi:alpha-L-fucosidase